VNGGQWHAIDRLREKHPVIGGQFLRKYAVTHDEIKKAEDHRASLPPHMGELIVMRKGLSADAAQAGGGLSAAVSAGDVADYGKAAAGDAVARSAAHAALSDFDARHPHVRGEIGRRTALAADRGMWS
jgi:hypothetical protein